MFVRTVGLTRYNLVDLTNFVSLEEEYLATVHNEREEEQYTAVIPTFDDGFMYRHVVSVQLVGWLVGCR